MTQPGDFPRGFFLGEDKARLLLFMLGLRGSRIRPNAEYTANQTMEMEKMLREVASDETR